MAAKQVYVARGLDDIQYKVDSTVTSLGSASTLHCELCSNSRFQTGLLCNAELAVELIGPGAPSGLLYYLCWGCFVLTLKRHGAL